MLPRGSKLDLLDELDDLAVLNVAGDGGHSLDDVLVAEIVVAIELDLGAFERAGARLVADDLADLGSQVSEVADRHVGELDSGELTVSRWP